MKSQKRFKLFIITYKYIQLIPLIYFMVYFCILLLHFKYWYFKLMRAARKPQIVLFLTHVYDTKRYLKNCLISVFDVFFPQLSNDVGNFFEIFHFHLQNLFHILFLAKNISGLFGKYPLLHRKWSTFDLEGKEKY